MNRLLLYILSWLNPFWKALGANPDHLHWILETKLMMDNRRPSFLQRGRLQKINSGNSTIVTVASSLIFGLIMMAFLISMNRSIFAFTIYFAFFILMLAMTLISDFTSVLIDVRDNYIILPKPVNDRTFLLARLLHIAAHLAKIVIPMAIPCLVYLVISNGIIGGALFAILILFVTVLSIFLINLVYLFILKITTPARFKEIINYIQIGFTIFIFAFYELFPQIMNNGSVAHIDLTSHSWIYYAPPFWFASAWDLLINHHLQQPLFITSFLALAIPVISVWIVIRFLAPSFNRKLSAISATPEDSGKAGDIRQQKQKSGISQLLANILIKNKTEEAGFIFGWKMTSRSRDFKLKVYPMFGYVIVFFLLFLMSDFGGNGQASKGGVFFRKGPGIIVLIYMCSLLIVNAMELIKFSNQYKASWVYYIPPMEKPGKLICGILKMLIIKYFILLYLVAAAIALFFRGISFIPNLLLGLVNVILITLLLGLYYLKTFPFSAQWSIGQTSGRMMRSFLLVISAGIVGIVHYFVMNYMMVVVILTALVAVADWLLLNSFGSKIWEQLEE